MSVEVQTKRITFQDSDNETIQFRVMQSVLRNGPTYVITHAYNTHVPASRTSPSTIMTIDEVKALRAWLTAIIEEVEG